MRTICLALTLIVLVTGCATGQDSSEIPADSAKIIFTASGTSPGVSFWTSTSNRACSGFRGAGSVLDSRDYGALSKGLAAMLWKDARPMAAQPGVRIQVKGQGETGGTVVTSFVPEKGHSYQVNFVNGVVPSQCRQNVTDITDPAHPVSVGQPLACR